MFWWHLRQDNMRTHYPRQLVLDFMTPGVIVVFLPGKLWCNCLVNCPWQSHHAFMKKSSYLVACDSKHFPSWFFTIFHLQVAMSKYIPAHINLGPPPMALSPWALRHCTRPLLKWSNHMSLLPAVGSLFQRPARGERLCKWARNEPTRNSEMETVFATFFRFSTSIVEYTRGSIPSAAQTLEPLE
jgi:hypothetical protein